MATTQSSQPVQGDNLQTPKTPSTPYRDDFNLTPNTNTTTSFADSGFFSSPTGDPCHGTGYKDWVLFPSDEGEEDGSFGDGSGFLDTRGFFRDADECVMIDYESDVHHEEEYSQNPTTTASSSLTLDSHAPYSPHTELVKALENHHISSSPPPKSPKLPRSKDSEDEESETSMLQIWQQRSERHELLSYKFEQPPYTSREHLLPVFRQSSRVRKNGAVRPSQRKSVLRN
ncbi:uncharacterized protein LY89DRAFT_124993 [Mollisia scopiformis]|uniref:Uncharacterized protein n=1 Tax=Mollisia scopiformis TaxID=149040 RepID=A0A194X416_MOLSC|nr:uncharacterized protein LY89DRAFT_124993 [Mollisia scopiformis]KUJ14928.1 hypothetical protein LY89DRAFT_124993 [Mollisia scopiformis]